MSARRKPIRVIDAAFIDAICHRLRSNERVRRRLPGWGWIHIDRQLPFLCVYRKPNQRDDAGTERLATSEASYLVCTGSRRLQGGLTELVAAVARTLVEEFGACLVLELWSAEEAGGQPATTTETVPTIRVVAPRQVADDGTLDELVESLSRIRLGKRKPQVTSKRVAKCCPKGLSPLLSNEMAREIGCHLYGLEVTPIYRAPDGRVYPDILRNLRHKLTVALRRAFFQFSREHTTHQPPHYHALGRRAVVKAVWEVDRVLADVSDAFDFLLLVSPVNGEQAWTEFNRERFQRLPRFHYRPLPTEPIVLKRQLYRAPVERVEDPALGQLFREKLDELDRQITMLQDRNTSRFLHQSLQLFGDVDESLYQLAVRILENIPARSREESGREQLTAEAFAELARGEIQFLKRQWPGLNAQVTIREDVTGLLTSKGSLLVGHHVRVPAARAEALIQHEIGTHVLTYHNGRAQRFRQLYTGLAGYDALQEGLAVLTEYLVGGLSRPRLRLLAARVVAARRLIQGATFLETYRELDRDYDFARRVAFQVTMRAYRSGGLTKDAVYLAGLRVILEYLAKGGELEPLLVGKLAAQHIPIVRELQWRGVLKDPPLTPRYLHRADALTRLDALRQGVDVLDLLN